MKVMRLRTLLLAFALGAGLLLPTAPMAQAKIKYTHKAPKYKKPKSKYKRTKGPRKVTRQKITRQKITRQKITPAR